MTIKQQYDQGKRLFLNSTLLFVLGDFVEAFFEDAHTISKILDLTLTTRKQPNNISIPMTGFPKHQLDQYLLKLTSSGLLIAVITEPLVKGKTK